MSIFSRVDPAETGHEQVIHCQDLPRGLRAIIAIHSTRLGPALGGSRFYPYKAEEQALTDVLRLSKAMTYKAAAAGLRLGGGKAVILGDPSTDKTPGLLRAFGQAVDRLGGRYITACDVGTFSQDMDVVAEATPYVTTRTVQNGGSGDSAASTALGVLQSMRAAAVQVWGDASLEGRRVGIEGVGKVGRHLLDLLAAEGARISISDRDHAVVAAAEIRRPEIEVLPVAGLRASSLDIYAPCALGGSVNFSLLDELRARIICGAANNQLADQRVAKELHAKGTCVVPDYIANAGGLIQAESEVYGYDEAHTLKQVSAIFENTLALLELAEREGLTPGDAAHRIAERRLADSPLGEPAAYPKLNVNGIHFAP